MSGVSVPPFVVAATALALRREGMTACGNQVVRLSEELRALPPPFGDDPSEALRRACHAVVRARLQFSESAFSDAQHALRSALAVYWAKRASGLKHLRYR